jgi:hypothetical protein
MTTITTLPSPPLRSDPATFAARGDTFLSALPNFTIQTNAVATEINTAAAIVAANSIAAGASAAAASASASMVNFKGDWSSLTGAYNVPTIVRHSGAYWSLTTNTTNITTITPGVSASWVSASPFAIPGVDEPYKTPQIGDLGDLAFVDFAQLRPLPELKTSAYTVTEQDAGKILIVSGTTTITLPDALPMFNPSRPFCIGIKAITGSVVTVARTGSNTIETVAGNKSMTANAGLWFFPSSTTAWETI